MRAEARGYAPAVVTLPQRGGLIEIALERGGALEVVVIDADGRPEIGAVAEHSAIAAGMPVVTRATTDDLGIAYFDALATGTGQILVLKPGVGAARATDVAITGGRTTRLTLVLEGGRELTGLVTSGADGRPVAGASVDVSFPLLPGHAPPPAVTSDAEGRYRLQLDVAAGEAVRLRARHPTYADTIAWLNLTDTVVDALRVDLALAQGVFPVVGRVVRADGSGVAGATVTHWQSPPGEVPPMATSAADGRFEIAPPPGAAGGTKVAVIASSPTEGVGTTWTVVSARGAPPPAAIEIRVGGSGTLEGTVRDEAGRATPGAVVTASVDWEGMQRRNAALGQRTGEWTTFQALQEPGNQNRLTTVTDDTGHFALPGVAAAWYRVTARWAGLAATTATTEVQPGGRARTDLVVSEDLVIEGVVLDAAEKPVPGAILWAQPGPQRPPGTPVPPGVRSQDDGRFELRGVVGGLAYAIHASATGHGTDHAQNVVAGARGVTLRLRSLGWIEGHVLRDGDPVTTPFSVRLVGKAEAAAGGLPESGATGGPGLARTFRAPDGAFVLPGIAGGEYVVAAFTPDGRFASQPVPVTVAEGRGASPVRLALGRSGRIRGLVLGVDESPAVNAWLQVFRVQEASRPEALVGGTRSGDDGKFTVEGLGGGTYVVRIGANRALPWAERVEVRPGEETRVRFVEAPPGRVRFSVVDALGRPIAGAGTVLIDAAGVAHEPSRGLLTRDGLLDPADREAWSRVGVTDIAGLSTRHHVPRGRYRAGATHSEFVAATDLWIEVGPGSTTDVTIALAASSR